MQNKKHYFIIVNYNSGDHIIECIKSILQSKNIIPNIVIVDNASRDNSLESCKLQFPDITYIYNTHNIGFAAGANVGAKFALERNAQTITFCNPDAILDPECAYKLIQTITSKKADVISPIIYKPNSLSIWFECGDISFYSQRAIHTKSSSKMTDLLQKTDYVSGCIMTVATSIFQKIELFDERFFLYYEDVDLSFRATKAGFTLAIDTQAKAWHKEISEQDNSQKTYFLVLSGLLFFDKHSTSFLQKLWFSIRFELRKLKNNLDLKKNKPLAEQVHKAYIDYEKNK